MTMPKDFPKPEIPYRPQGEYEKWCLYDRLKQKVADQGVTPEQYREACKYIAEQLGI